VLVLSAPLLPRLSQRRPLKTLVLLLLLLLLLRVRLRLCLRLLLLQQCHKTLMLMRIRMRTLMLMLPSVCAHPLHPCTTTRSLPHPLQTDVL
jgi:hypothetical protein